MGLEGMLYTGSKTDDEMMREEQEWMDKTKDRRDMLNSNEIIDRYKKYYDLVCKLISEYLGNFLRKEDVTNGLMQTVKYFAEEYIKVRNNSDNKDEELLESYEDELASSLIRVFTNRDMKISNEQEDQFQDGIDLFIEALKKELSSQ